MGTPATPAHSSLPAADRVGQAFDRVYARRELQDAGEPWSARAVRWLIEHLAGRDPHGAGTVATVAGWVALAVLAMALVVLVVRALRARRPAHGRGQRRAAPPSDDAAVAAVAAAERSLVAALAEAARLADEGRFLEAAHTLYRGTLATLERRGRVRLDETKTGGDYARELAGTADATGFAALLRAYYPVAYGHTTPAREPYEAVRAAAAALRSPS